MIRVRFLTTDGLVSSAIRKMTGSLFSHCEFGTPEGTWIGAHIGDGIQGRPASAEGWDTSHFQFAHLVRTLLTPIADAGTCIDSGGGADSSDLWVKFGGVEYYLSVSRSGKQRAKDEAAKVVSV